MLNFLKSKEDRYLSKRIKKLTGYYPSNLKLYKLAFTHKTIAESLHNGEIKADNERLEYLGDAVLDLVAAHVLFNHFPYKGEGFMTDMRSKMVSREQLGNIAVTIGLDELVSYDRHAINGRGVKRIIGGNALEALIGAFYIDKGYKKTARFIKKRIIDIHLDFKQLEESEISYKGLMYQYAQRCKKEVKFEIVREFRKGNDYFFEMSISIDDEILASETYHSKRKAEELASEKAYKKLCEMGEITVHCK